eukprot:14625281-Heterocapsa_arctica.AAC.1
MRNPRTYSNKAESMTTAGLSEKTAPVGVQRNTMRFRTNPHHPSTQSTAHPAGDEQDTRPC